MNPISALASLGRPATAALAAIGLLLVGYVDVETGSDIRVLSLYSLPVAWCGWRLARAGAVLSAAAAVAVWGISQSLTGAGHWTAATWTFNIVSQGVALLAIGGLVAELAARLEAERASSRTDALTGLRNRRAISLDGAAALALCRRHARPVSLAFIDLDDFKQVNDRLGHSHGDALLKACAATLEGNCRSTDLVGRLGGDEFVVMMPETTSTEAAACMERARQAFAQRSEVAGSGVSMTIGVMTQTAAAGELAELLARADELMYEAKRSGKGRVLAREIDLEQVTG